MNVYSIILPYSTTVAKLKSYKPTGLIISGSPASIHDHSAPQLDEAIWSLDLPIFTICYGMQYMLACHGGMVEKSLKREFGKAQIAITSALKHTSILPRSWLVNSSDLHQVWMSHGDHVAEVGDNFRVLATTTNGVIAMVEHKSKPWYGVQFHPEVVHTPQGMELLRQFVITVSNTKNNWTMDKYLHTALASVREIVGEEKQVLCGLSGGVDSSVTAVLLHQAIGDRLTCVFVDTGLLRKDERQQVESLFRQHYQINLKVVDASDLFLSALKGITDPEQKRKIIGKLFIEVFEDTAKQAESAQDIEFLAQGTLYPDVIESISMIGGKKVTIKSHHNVGGLPEKMNMQLVEPLRELFKDEVRALGRELGLDQAFVARHPFPGPGLAVRVLGEVTADKVRTLQQADAIYINKLHQYGLYDEIWQAFAVLLPVKTVGVMGDDRTYAHVCSLRAVVSEDGMTAHTYPFSHEFLEDVANSIINNVPDINRVVYDITSKPPGTIEWE
jgi:GMP synthase (glutamine-hydrolysing)